jgi:hypothetical protein
LAESAHFRTVSRFFAKKAASVSDGILAFQNWNLFHAGTVHGAAIATTTARVRPISLLPMKHTAFYWRVSGLPAASRGQLLGCANYPLKVS